MPMLPHRLPEKLYTASQVRQLDKVAIEQFGIPGFTLMRRAGHAAFNQLINAWPNIKSITIICGTGNNGGDGFIVAALAAQNNISVQLIQVGDDNKIKNDALTAHQSTLEAGIKPLQFSKAIALQGDLIVDALLGTGLEGDVKQPYKTVIEKINNTNKPVFSIDIPSGLCSDTGMPLGCSVKASQTITFIGVKQGLLTGRAAHFAGKVSYHTLNVPNEIFDHVDYSCLRIDVKNTLPALPKRKADSHKGHYGHILVIGGDYGMAGAVSMAAEAAARTGAGLVSAITRPEHVTALVSRRPEVMAYGYPLPSDPTDDPVTTLLQKASVVVIGPGLGQSTWSKQFWKQVLATQLPLIVDADGLSLLAMEKSVRRDNWILTPHPGEAARLLNVTTDDIQHNRFDAVKKLQQKYKGTVILKGSGSLIHSDQSIALCNAGNPGMATGGMGDVLSGILGGLVAQGLTLPDVAKLGVCLHAHSADLAAQQFGECGLLATDLLFYLRQLINQK